MKHLILKIIPFFLIFSGFAVEKNAQIENTTQVIKKKANFKDKIYKNKGKIALGVTTTGLIGFGIYKMLVSGKFFAPTPITPQLKPLNELLTPQNLAKVGTTGFKSLAIGIKAGISEQFIERPKLYLQQLLSDEKAIEEVSAQVGQKVVTKATDFLSDMITFGLFVIP